MLTCACTFAPQSNMHSLCVFSTSIHTLITWRGLTGFLMNQITLLLVKQEHMFSGWIRTRVFLFMCSSTVTLNI